MTPTPEPTPARLDKGALFRMLGYVPHAGQRRVHESEAGVRALAAGARWGKSRCAVMELLAFALAPGPAALAWVAAPRFEVVDLIFNDLLRQLGGGLAHRLVERNGRALVVGTPRGEGSWFHRLFELGRSGGPDVAA